MSVGELVEASPPMAPAQRLGDLKGRGVHAAPHARHATRQSHPDTARNPGHRRARTARTRARAEPSTSRSTIDREPSARAISIRPVAGALLGIAHPVLDRCEALFDVEPSVSRLSSIDRKANNNSRLTALRTYSRLLNLYHRRHCGSDVWPARRNFRSVTGISDDPVEVVHLFQSTKHISSRCSFSQVKRFRDYWSIHNA